MNRDLTEVITLTKDMYLEPDNHETVQIVDMRLANKVQGIAERQIFTPDDKIFVIVFQLQVLDVLEQVLGTKR
jgi:hypothetical protein